MQTKGQVVLGALACALSAFALACGGGAAGNAAAATPADATATGAKAPAPPTAATDPSLPKAQTKPDSDRCTWKKEGAKSCHTGAKGDGDLTAAVTGMANACIDTKKMHMVGTPITGEGNRDNMVKSVPLKVQANHCYRILGLAQATVTDFDIALMDSDSKSCGEDINDSNDAILLEDGLICFKADDTVNLNAAVAAGQGKWAIEVWSD